jgi:hypothetical protein
MRRALSIAMIERGKLRAICRDHMPELASLHIPARLAERHIAPVRVQPSKPAQKVSFGSFD